MAVGPPTSFCELVSIPAAFALRAPRKSRPTTNAMRPLAAGIIGPSFPTDFATASGPESRSEAPSVGIARNRFTAAVFIAWRVPVTTR